MTRDKKKTICQIAYNQMLNNNPERDPSHKCEDWAIENFIDRIMLMGYDMENSRNEQFALNFWKAMSDSKHITADKNFFKIMSVKDTAKNKLEIKFMDDGSNILKGRINDWDFDENDFNPDFDKIINTRGILNLAVTLNNEKEERYYRLVPYQILEVIINNK